MVKNPPAVQETQFSTPELRRSPGEGNGNPLQYACLESSMDRAWRATAHGVAERNTTEWLTLWLHFPFILTTTCILHTTTRAGWKAHVSSVP